MQIAYRVESEQFSTPIEVESLAVDAEAARPGGGVQVGLLERAKVALRGAGARAASVAV